MLTVEMKIGDKLNIWNFCYKREFLLFFYIKKTSILLKQISILIFFSKKKTLLFYSKNIFTFIYEEMIHWISQNWTDRIHPLN
jgi:hypothetical protein